MLRSRTRPSSATCATLRPRRLVANRQRRVRGSQQLGRGGAGCAARLARVVVARQVRWQGHLQHRRLRRHLPQPPVADACVCRRRWIREYLSRRCCAAACPERGDLELRRGPTDRMEGAPWLDWRFPVLLEPRPRFIDPRALRVQRQNVCDPRRSRARPALNADSTQAHAVARSRARKRKHNSHAKPRAVTGASRALLHCAREAASPTSPPHRYPRRAHFAAPPGRTDSHRHTPLHGTRARAPQGRPSARRRSHMWRRFTYPSTTPRASPLSHALPYAARAALT